MEDSVKHKAVTIIKENIKNLDLICYFCKSTIKTPIFLGVIQRKYQEIKPLLTKDLIIDLKPVKSYEFHLDKFENFFYQKYQEKIDFLKYEIWKKKRKKDELIKKTEDNVPEMDCEDYDQKLQEILVFARKAINDLDKMEMEKEHFNNLIGQLQEEMKKDPFYKFLFFIRNDKDIVFNKRTEDKEVIIHKKILNYLNECSEGSGWKLYKILQNKGFFKEYSPAKNYYISDLGLCVDSKLREIKWLSDDEDYQKTEEEIAQEEEFNKIKECFNF